MLGIKLLSISDRLSTALQAPKLAAVEAQAMADGTVEVLQNLRNSTSHANFYAAVIKNQTKLGK